LHGDVKQGLIIPPVDNICRKSLTGRRQMPSVFHVEIHEGTDMEDFLDGRGSREFIGEMFRLENITVSLSPRCVIHLCHNKVWLFRIRLAETIIKGDWIKDKTKMPQLGQ